MSEFYAVERNNSHLAHLNEAGTGGGSLTIRKHKYVARVPKANGKYRYFYSSFEVDAYKRARAKGWGEAKSAEAAKEATSSDTRSLREKWEERRGMLSGSGSGKSGKGSGGRGGSGKGKGSGGKGGSGKSSKSTTTKQGKMPLISAGARVYKGPSTGDGLSPEEIAKKKKKAKKAASRSTSVRFASAYTPNVIRRR